MKVEVKIPSVGESVNSAVIGSWQKAEGDYVERDEILVLLETDKASMEVPSEHSGQLEILKKDGESAQVGEVIGFIDTSVTAPSKSSSEKAKTAVSQETGSSPSSEKKIPFSEKKKPVSEQKTQHTRHSHISPASFDPSQFSPAVRHTLMEKNIDPLHIQGTGKGGRITKSDVQNFKGTPFSNSSKVEPFQESAKDGGIRRERMTTIRKRIAERLVASQHGTATLTTFNEVDMTRIIQLRKEYQEVFQKKYGIKLGFMGFFIKAVIQAMRAYPRVGAQIQGDELVYFQNIHISIAVSTKKGLIVPVIRYADQMSIAEIEKAVLHFAQKAREGQIRPDDLTGGSFTISNGGVFGSLLSTPILNPPQSGILGMHKIEKRPIVQKDQIVIRPMMYLALSYDHRIVDGKESVGFLVTLKECIEEPSRILLNI